jgi:hypothetical protein
MVVVISGALFSHMIAASAAGLYISDPRLYDFSTHPRGTSLGPEEGAVTSRDADLVSGRPSRLATTYFRPMQLGGNMVR